MAIDKTGNITLNKAGDAAIPFQLTVSDWPIDISGQTFYFVVDNGMVITPDVAPGDPTTRVINITPDQLVRLGTKTRAYDLIRVVDGKRTVFLSATITATGFAVSAGALL